MIKSIVGYNQLGRVLFQRCCSTINVNSYTDRTHNCGELRAANVGERVRIYGWLSYKRMNQFIVLRDAYGSVQARINENSHAHLQDIVKSLRYESVIKLEGTVVDRNMHRNADMVTGEIEIDTDSIELLNDTPPVLPYSLRYSQNEELRLKYRYIDIRSAKMQNALRLRSDIVHQMRRFLNENAKFIEIETPTLFRTTPGGAAEFVVPASDTLRGQFYSLPQSPQQFKQLLMIAGMDRYYQMARCYRDEKSKLDRQPEFTQVDLELSFTDQSKVIALVEDLIINSWPHSLETLRPIAPFKQLKYVDAIRLYGSDKPDLRIDWKIEDCTQTLSFLRRSSDDETHWCARVLVARGIAEFITNAWKTESERVISMNRTAQPFEVFTNRKSTWFKQLPKQQLIDQLHLNANDAVAFWFVISYINRLFYSWGNPDSVHETLGYLRNMMADVSGHRAKQTFAFVWIVDFPLFTKNNETNRIESSHHPFTAPIDTDAHLLFDGDPLKITAQHYDLVLNGVELGGGSIRIHNADVQRHVLTNILNEDINTMQYFLEALSMGAPSMGGFALGLDRYMALLISRGNSSISIREVIAFPKSKTGRDLMCSSPVKPTDEQLKRYGLQIVVETESTTNNQLSNCIDTNQQQSNIVNDKEDQVIEVV